MQVSGSITRLPPCSLIEFTGQESSHAAQLVQSSVIVCAMVPPPRNSQKFVGLFKGVIVVSQHRKNVQKNCIRVFNVQVHKLVEFCWNSMIYQMQFYYCVNGLIWLMFFYYK
jgi:hypothetical protein